MRFQFIFIFSACNIRMHRKISKECSRMRPFFPEAATGSLILYINEAIITVVKKDCRWKTASAICTWGVTARYRILCRSCSTIHIYRYIRSDIILYYERSRTATQNLRPANRSRFSYSRA